MGRVARYKRIKACDPFAKPKGSSSSGRGPKARRSLEDQLQNGVLWGTSDLRRAPKKRSVRAQKLLEQKLARKKLPKKKEGSSVAASSNQRSQFDLPPSSLKDDFDLHDLVGSLRKEPLVDPNQDLLVEEDPRPVSAGPTQKSSPQASGAAMPSTANPNLGHRMMEDDRKVARILRLDEQVDKQAPQKKKEAQHLERQEGESKRAHRARLQSQVRQALRQDQLLTHQNSNPEKRQRKKEFLQNKKKKRKSTPDEVADNDDQGGDYDPRLQEDPVVFGEQAERPPVFRLLPRGAPSRSLGKPSNSQQKKKAMTDEDIAEEQHQMELMRRQVQAQYAAIKAKRRKTHDFHL